MSDGCACEQLAEERKPRDVMVFRRWRSLTDKSVSCRKVRSREVAAEESADVVICALFANRTGLILDGNN
jgi:hypothetical protein